MNAPTLRVKITLPDGETWFATAYPSEQMTEKRIAKMNRLAVKQGLNTTYAAATEAEYQAYKSAQKAAS